jgi:hypothetical protein
MYCQLLVFSARALHAGVENKVRNKIIAYPNSITFYSNGISGSIHGVKGEILISHNLNLRK